VIGQKGIQMLAGLSFDSLGDKFVGCRTFVQLSSMIHWLD
jgi:hypothetical protein